MSTLVLAILTSLSGCTSPPVYNGIANITVHTQDSRGTKQEELSGDRLDKARACLYRTEEVGQDEASAELLQSIIMIQVKDRLGDRMFELYTNENFKGNKGKYYRNSCIYSIIRG
jgi:hypothetical protein